MFAKTNFRWKSYISMPLSLVIQKKNNLIHEAMSRGFVKEGDQEEIPMVPPRAYLPEGATNYVTQVGMDELLAEKEKLINEKEHLNKANENEKRIALNHINAKLYLLNNRIDTAIIVPLDEQPQNEIRFGARVTLKIEESKRIKTFQIVGVDEADVSKGKISFVSPLANELIDKKIGDKVVLKRPKKDIVYEIMDIAYA
ncbi:GreA/GreB family elongation factor [Proteiniphilum sp. UBA1028]|jgi:transcription elongation factor GreB|uniref:GreA/GreB family elongation factor n=1 Tax=Proteiniphilum sp. UBA1028 TaxID=1947251 RepID=UPI0025F74A61|nr:GreA/GreB family elongation factor [Proteiniphilum sp. UBA1028]